MLCACVELSVARLAQLTQKSIQSDLTTCRFTQTVIRTLAARTDVDVLSLRLVDRFGDSGTIGVVILVHEEAVTRIDTFLLSCRALGRGVESALLSLCLARAAARGAVKVKGEFGPTAKNGQVADFYPRHGFSESSSEGSSPREFRFE